ncbi:helix-turn-helix domain-containing protein [Ruminococcus sp.]|uniref:helix-turn-helix domain-containing protein n=1 Tax=Ruminococcus sp. TaxID=41978 RepID=UPI003AB8794D
MHIYQRIRDLREDADLTQKQIAEILNMHTTQYRRYECGESEVPLEIACKLANYYKVSLDYIAGRTNDKQGLTRSELDDDETSLIKQYKKLNEKNKGRLLERLAALSEI